MTEGDLCRHPNTSGPVDRRVHFCYGPMTRILPEGNLVGRWGSGLGNFRYPAIQNTGLLTLALACLSPTEHTSHTSQRLDGTLSRHPALTPAAARPVPTRQKAWVPSLNAPQPVHRCMFLAFEPFKLPSRPLSEGLVEMPVHLDALRRRAPRAPPHGCQSAQRYSMARFCSRAARQLSWLRKHPESRRAFNAKFTPQSPSSN